MGQPLCQQSKESSSVLEIRRQWTNKTLFQSFTFTYELRVFSLWKEACVKQKLMEMLESSFPRFVGEKISTHRELTKTLHTLMKDFSVSNVFLSQVSVLFFPATFSWNENITLKNSSMPTQRGNSYYSNNWRSWKRLVVRLKPQGRTWEKKNEPGNLT